MTAGGVPRYGFVRTCDPETYLRLVCEKAMAGDPHRGRPAEGADIGTAARALMAAGLLDEPAVQAVVDEYVTAAGLRGSRPWSRFRRAGGGERRSLSCRRVAPGPFEVDTEGRRVLISKVVFTDTDTQVHASGIGGRATGPGRPPGFSVRPHPGNPGVLALADDRGTTAVASPGGWGSSGQSWTATFVTPNPLSAETAWIDVEGTRIELPPRGAAAEVRVEPAEPDGSLRHGLEQEMLAGLEGESSLEGFVAALEAVGAVDPDDPDVAEARKVAAALSGGVLASGVLAGGAVARGLRAPWDRIVGRMSASNGTVGQMVVGAAVEEVAGHSVRIDALSSEPDGFSVDVAVSPGSALLRRHFPGLRLHQSPITWWAEDDRQNAYLGIPTSHGGSDSLSEGTIVFGSPLDPAATRLDLILAGQEERAVISFSLDALTPEPMTPNR